MKKHIEAILSNAILAVIGLLSFMILSRNLPPSLFGTWVLFLSVSTFIDLIRFGLTRNATIRLIVGQDLQRSHSVNGAGLRVGFKILILLSTFSLSLWTLGRNIFSDTYELIWLWYPVIGLSNIFWNNGLTWLQSRNMYRHITLLRGVNTISFLVFILLLIYMDRLTINHIIIAYVLSNALCSVLSLIKGWDSARYMHSSPRDLDANILDFGRYSTVSNIGSSLLKSADSFIISLSPVLGTTAVAVYSIPFKIVEMLELPIRSIATVGYNTLCEAIKSENPNIRQLVTRYVIVMALLIIPAIVFIAIFPDFILNVLGGAHYKDYMPQMRIMLYMLLVYGLILIPDRMSGVLLEAIGRPKANTVKIAVMAAANILGNLIAVFYFESLLGVIFATVVFVVIGVVVGYGLTPAQFRPSIGDFVTEFRNIPSRWKTFSSKREN